MIQKSDHVHVVDAPDAFRGKFKGKNAGKEYAEQVKQVLEQNKGKVAAYIGKDSQIDLKFSSDLTLQYFDCHQDYYSLHEK